MGTGRNYSTRFLKNCNTFWILNSWAERIEKTKDPDTGMKKAFCWFYTQKYGKN